MGVLLLSIENLCSLLHFNRNSSGAGMVSKSNCYQFVRVCALARVHAQKHPGEWAEPPAGTICPIWFEPPSLFAQMAVCLVAPELAAHCLSVILELAGHYQSHPLAQI